MWVRGVQPHGGARDDLDPLDAPAGFYFVIYPKAGAASKPALQITLRKDGALVAVIQPDLPAADESGAIPVLPTNTFGAGRRTVRRDRPGDAGRNARRPPIVDDTAVSPPPLPGRLIR